jgi:hypothetical protein
MRRTSVILDTEDIDYTDSPIGKVFNTQWMEGVNIFPVACSRKECETFLPHWTETEEGFHLPMCETSYIPQRNREPIPKIVMKHKLFHFTTEHNMPALFDEFQKLIGCSLTVEQLHQVLDNQGYRKDCKKGRITTAIRSLRNEGIELKSKKVRKGTKTMNIYVVNEIKVSANESEDVILSKATYLA